MYWSTENEEKLDEILEKFLPKDKAVELKMELWREGFDVVDKSMQKTMIEHLSKYTDPRTFVSDNIEAFRKRLNKP